MHSSSQISPRCLINRDGRLDYYECFLPGPETWLNNLKNKLNWRQDTITMFGKTHPIPRLQAWYGDAGASYSYSRIELKPNEWIPELLELKEGAEKLAKARFQGVLCNFYRDGRDYAALHSDNEPELGNRPVIASISLGTARKFKLRHSDGEVVDIWPKSGSLLVMSGRLQESWKHELPKSLKIKEPRLNLTFRPIIN